MKDRLLVHYLYFYLLYFTYFICHTILYFDLRTAPFTWFLLGHGARYTRRWSRPYQTLPKSTVSRETYLWLFGTHSRSTPVWSLFVRTDVSSSTRYRGSLLYRSPVPRGSAGPLPLILVLHRTTTQTLLFAVLIFSQQFSATPTTHLTPPSPPRCLGCQSLQLYWILYCHRILCHEARNLVSSRPHSSAV